ncbi:hypothetical protein ACRS2I_12725 [Pseudomonas aeruginosa]|uniref:hypothetical protein n=1 Tax=Pseudomonas aeruginosa TaxID=287 RepID=UPI003EE16B0F
MKKAAPQYQQSSPRKADSSTAAPSKIARVLAYLLTGASINRFEAERLGDHCLNSTIAVLANAHRLAFVRQQERVPNRWGAPCVVTRYSLLTSELDEARKVLACLKRTARRTTEG